MVLKRLTLCTGSQNNVSVHVPLVLQYSMDYSTSDYLLANPLALKSHSETTHTHGGRIRRFHFVLSCDCRAA